MRSTPTRIATAIGCFFATATSSFAHEAASLTLADVTTKFESANVVSGPSIVDCVLSGGSKTECFQITIKPEPTAYVPGPWCPQNLSDGPEMSGIWLKDGLVYDADGAFFSELSTLYNDQKWSMVDPETGNIKVTDTKEQCAAAANPNVGPEYENFCVQCLPEYVDENATVTYTIPLKPVTSTKTTPVNTVGSGIAFNGIRLDGPAPVDAITGAYTIAPFDDCGGHINLHVGYHYHAVTKCQEDAGIETPHATQIGIAMDGHPIMTHHNADGSHPTDLDMCNGHATGDEAYHYHAGEAGSNAILTCLVAEVGCVSEIEGAACDATKVRRGPPPGGAGGPPPPPQQ